jgi:hypothetical protein
MPSQPIPRPWRLNEGISKRYSDCLVGSTNWPGTLCKQAGSSCGVAGMHHRNDPPDRGSRFRRRSLARPRPIARPAPRRLVM